MKFGLKVFKDDGTIVFDIRHGNTSFTDPLPVQIAKNGMLEIVVQHEIGHRSILLVPPTLNVLWWELGEDE